MLNEMDDFGERLKRLRLAVNISREDLAYEMGVTASTVFRWETGRGRPSRLAYNAVERFLSNQQWGVRQIFYGQPKSAEEGKPEEPAHLLRRGGWNTKNPYLLKSRKD